MRSINRLIRHTAAFSSITGRWLLLLGVGLTGFPTVHAATLDPTVLPKIQAATFEVVEAKPVNDPLTYEKPLPLDLLPYQERTDKYYSIGTAFAIGNNRYVTAGHVLLAGTDSLWGPPELRDSKGHVYAIDKIEKFSLRKDFVVFTLAESPGDAALALDTKPVLNQVVYAVGNALGTGVVIRDGLYTSDTPEQQDGEWKWMRFSAAASPGNSGGPLLDKDGKVIGVVLMKSASENLNYALPISEVLNAPDGQAILDTRIAYLLDVIDTQQNGVFKANFALPMSLGDFYRNFQTRFDAYNNSLQKALLKRESANLFPLGVGSARLLYQQTMTNSRLELIMRGSNGEWGLSDGNSRYYSLDGNGYVDAATAGHNGLFHLRRPDGLNAANFYGDAKLQMDLLLKTGLLKRVIGGEKIKVTSLGKPIFEAQHIDHWQRPWRVDVWSLPYANAHIAVYSLPVPDGSEMMTRVEPAAQEHDARLDLDELSNFVHVDYQGTLAQWKDFLKEPALQPAAFKKIHIDFDYGHRFSYASPRVAFSYTPEVQAITPESLLSVNFRVILDNGQPVWDVADVDVEKGMTPDQDGINIQRFSAPPVGVDEDITNRWQKLTGRQFPYNAVARNENGLMMIDAVVVPAVANSKSPQVLYTAFYGVGGAPSQTDMKSKLDLLMEKMTVMEH